MKISIFGLGYVGCVSAGCLAKMGHQVVGVDVAENKVQLINSGKPTIIEKDIEELIREGWEGKMLMATQDTAKAVADTDVSIIAVGTPSTPQGHLNLDYIYRVAQQIGTALKGKGSFHVVAIRSTVLPGTNQRVGELIAESSGKICGKDFAVVSNPEFLREGSAVRDYFNPPLTLIGTDCPDAESLMREMYQSLPGDVVVTGIPVAEIMKYVNNTYHALKVVFGNEVGTICKSLGIDSHEVMRIFCMDKELNISPYYFKPGFAYGGSCLPKDTKALNTLARDLYLETPVISNIDRSNELHKDAALRLILDKGMKQIAVLGLSFKAGTDDLRSSPIVDIVERLLGKGFDIRIFDRNVKLSELTGTNKDYIEAKIPHLQQLISSDIDEVIGNSELVVIVNKEAEFTSALEKHPGKTVIDLVRMWETNNYQGTYEGLCW